MFLCFIHTVFHRSQFHSAVEAEVNLASFTVHEVNSVLSCRDRCAIWAFSALIQGRWKESLLCLRVLVLKFDCVLDISNLSVSLEEAAFRPGFVKVPVWVLWITNRHASPAEACMTVSAVHLAASTDALDWLVAARASLWALHDVYEILLLTNLIECLRDLLFGLIMMLFCEFFQLGVLAPLKRMEWIAALQAEFMPAPSALTHSFLLVQFGHFSAVCLRTPAKFIHLVNCLW